MDEKYGFTLTPRDRLVRAWQNAAELVRDFETYAKEEEMPPEASALFERCAKEQAKQAASFLTLLKQYG